MRRILKPFWVVLGFFVLLSYDIGYAQCGANTASGSRCLPRSGNYHGQINADLGCGSYRTVTNYGPGRYFRMPVLQGGCYTIQTCGAPIDTQIGVFQALNTSTSFAYNDDNGPVCTGTAASVVITPTFTDYARVDVRQFSCRAGGTSSITVRVRQNNNLSITNSSANMCQGQTRTLTAVPARAVGGSTITGQGNRGTFSGTGVSGTTFTAPTPAGANQLYTNTYTFGYCTRSQNIRVYRNPTTANAGPNQTVCGGSASTAANTASIGTGSWQVISGSGTFANANDPTTTITGLGVGTNVFRWRITNGPCTASSDDVSITNTGPCCSAPVIASNPSGTSVCPNATATFTASFTGASSVLWQVSTNGGTTWQALANGSPYSGVTTNTLTINPASLSLNGNLYRLTGSACTPVQITNSNAALLTVSDNTNPTISCPSNITVNAASGTCAANVTYTLPTANDNCPGVSVTRIAGPASGSSFGVGTTTVTHRANDVAGNTATCSFTVTVNDNQNPTIACPSNITVNAASGACTANVTYGAPTFGDNCPGATVARIAGPASGSSFSVGTTTVTYRATDAAGNTATCSFTVTVNDNQNPTIACPSNITVNAASGSCAANVTYGAPTFGDNCPGATVARIAGPASSGSFAVGTTTVTYRATDAAGNTATCSFTVTVNDNQNPTIACPSNITVNAATGACAANVTYSAPTFGDNCPGSTVARIAGPASGASFPVGTTTVTYRATDAAGKTATCSFTVTVNDNQNPTIACPSNITVNAASGACAANVTYGAPTFGDNCPGATVARIAGPASGGSFAVGTTTVTYRATDAAGNTSTCSFTVTVNDNQNPTISCPSNITVNAASGACNANVTYGTPTFADNCPGATIARIAGPASGSAFPVGSTTVTHRATDAAGNTATCSFTVTVNDNQNPTISCPSNITVNAATGTCAANVTYSAPTFGDNCPGSTVARIAGPASGASFPVGTTTVTFRATDATGNTATCSFTVTVNDNQNPTISCPSNINVNAAGGTCAANVTYSTPTFADNCPGATIARTAGPASGASFTVGITTVTYQATDAAGNTNSCSFTVTVNDNQNPTITCPANITTNNDPGACNAVVTYTAPVGADNCPGVTTARTGGLGSGATFPVGNTSVTYTATDAAGNTTDCSFTVTVIDNQNPTISCPANIVQNNNSGVCGATVTFFPPFGTDNCSGSTTAQTAGFGSGSTFPVGVTTNTYTVTDASGNTASCSFTVTINDNEAPVISCPANVTLNNDAGLCTAVYSYTAPSGTDNCPGATTALVSGLGSGANFPVGTTTEGYQVTDAAGNVSSCSFTVTVNDNEAPVISCPSNIIQSAASGSCNKVVNYTTPVGTDNCPGVVTTLTSGFGSGGTFPVGVTTVGYLATDAAGNTDNCSFTVTIEDNENPVIACPSNISVGNDPGQCNAVVTYTAPVGTDNCPGATTSLTAGQGSGGTFALGTNTETYLVTDASGNTASCSFTITVSDTENPVITCLADTTVSTDAGVCTRVLFYSGITATDNCPGRTISQSSGIGSGGTFPIGITTETYLVTDASGNTASCSFNVTVEDNEAPVIAGCPANITVANNPNTCDGNASWTPPTASDNCSTPTISTTTPPGSTFPVGVNTVTYVATDAVGNSAVCSFTVTVQDTQPPVLTNCPSNITTNNDIGNCSALVSWTPPTATDNCGLNSLSSTHPPGTTFPVGTTTVTYTANDNAGNSVSCSFTVTVIDNENPQLVGCPGNTVVNTATGTCAANVTWSTPSALDNCSIASFSGTHTSGSSFNLGITTVSYTAVDNSGNTATCSFTVTVEDNEDPVITNCPANMTVSTDPGVCNAVVNWTAPTASDNCSIASFSSTQSPGATFGQGTATIVYTAIDGSGNTEVCSFTITVEDNENPIIAGCPSNITVSADTNTCAANVSWTAPTASDNCGLASFSGSHAPGASFPVGTTTVTYSAVDSAGNSGTCAFTVTVDDNTAPVVSGCPANISLNNDPGICGAVATWTPPTATDNCSIASSTNSHSPGQTFAVGITTVTYTWTDPAGNTSTCSFDITVSDNEAPVTSCPASQTVNASPASCSASVTWTAPTSTDNCGVTSTSSSHTSGASFAVGTTVVTYTASDAAGNTDTCSFNITVVDNQNPIVTGCPSNISVSTDAGQCSAVVSWTAPSFTDNCPGVTVTSTHAPGATFLTGTTTVSYTGTDAAGNTANCTFTVTVTDNENPVIAGCPSNIIVSADTNACSANVSWTAPTASDNCGLASFSGSHTSGSSFPVGTTTVTYTAVDSAGNSAVCTFTITVDDNTAPVVANCPSNMTMSNDPGICGAVVTWTAPTATDNCSIASSTASHASGSTFNVGTTTVLYTWTDPAGNTSSCTFDVTINDTEAPVASCPASQTVNTFSGACSATVTWTAPTSTDNCAVTASNSTHISGSTFAVGTTTVTYTASDAAGNNDTCSFNITVVDNEAPVATGCPGNISVSTNAGQCSAVVSWTAPSFTDNCPGVTVTSTHAPGATFTTGTTTVVYIGTDASGNADTCSFNVTVTDNENPVIAGCPSNIIVSADTNACSANVSWTAPTASDNCGLASFSGSHPSGSSFPVGTTTVTYSAVDSAGNSAVCTFTITVDDNTAPVVANCPSNMTMSNDPGICGAVVTWTAPTATDNCSIASSTASHTPGSTFNVGTTTVLYTWTDPAGNTSSCTFDVTINDTEAPVASCPASQTVNTFSGACSATVTWTAPTSTDNCAVTASNSTHVSGSTFAVGTTTVTYTASDAAGNNDTCSFNITVVDNEAPVVTGCPGNISVSTDAGQCSAVVSWTAPSFTDNCPGVTVTSTHSPGTTFTTGTTTVVYIGTDASGNADTCSFNVTVTDNENPVIAGCPSNIIVSADTNACSANVSWTAPTASDNCGLASFSGSHTSGASFPVGTTTVTYTAVDSAGNSAVCTFTITVDDNTAPVVANCPSNMTMSNDPGICGAVVTWTAPTATDNCSIATSTASHASGSTFNVGTTTVLYTWTDPAGNTSSCTFDVTINDTEAPVASCPASQTVNTFSGACSATVTWTAPTSTDNCAVTASNSTHISGSTFAVGTTTVTYTASDAAGNSDTCSFNITVVDNEAPVATGCPGNISVSTDAGQCSAVVSWTAPSFTDNCPGVTVTSTHAPGATFTTGTTTVVYIGTDASGNADTCSFNVTVTDNENPVIAGCPSNIIVSADTNACSANVSWTAPTASDNCGLASFSGSHTSGSSFPVGTTTVTYTAVDSAGNSAVCTFTITVDDNTAPVVANCPSNMTMSNDPGICGAVVTWTAPTATDNCSIASSTASHASGSTFNVGTTTVLYTWTDPAGNTSSCTFDVTINDTEAPVASCPASQTVNTFSGACSATVTWTAPTSTDNCAVTASNSTHISGSTFAVGTTTVTYTASDAAGNNDTCSFNITVVDNEAPVATGCPGNISVSTDAGQCSAVVSWTAPSFTDNCPGVTVTSTHAPGATFTTGTTTVVYIGTDASGNADTCIFNVTVTDNENPVIVCPANITVSADSGACSTTVTYTAPVGTDNCPGVTTTQTGGQGSGTVFTVGTVTETYLATDSVGNTSTCSFTITVTDNENPVIVCPANISVGSDSTACSAIVSYTTPSGLDNCPGATTAQTTGQGSGTAFPVGTTTNTFVVTDASGNTASCSFTITVTDDDAPVITNCPANMTLNNTPGQCSATANWTAPTANDNCAVTSFTSTHTSGNSFPVGTTTVVYTAMDAAGNTTTCSFTITVNDVEDPQLIGCPANILVSAAPGRCDAVVNWSPPTAVDNCITVSLSGSHSPATVFPVGITTVTYIAIDAAGNSDSCSFDVIVVDNENPVITGCPSNIVVDNDSLRCDAVVNWMAPSATDNCGLQSFTNSHSPGDTFALGTTTVTYLATDTTGNTALCSFDITVEDNEDPVIVCPANIAVANDTGFCSAVVTYLTPVGVDNCPGAVTIQTTGLPSGATFPLGITTNTYVVTDAAGNSVNCSFDVDVTDQEAPVIVCPANISVNNDSTLCSAVVTYLITSSDNCTGDTLIQIAGLASGAAYPVGVTTNTFVATDAAGNTDTCSFTVTVTDNENPIITCPTNQTVSNDSSQCSAVVNYVVGTSDNCPGPVLAQTSGLPSGSAFPVGSTTNTFTLTDASGNSVSCSFNVVVLDTEIPVVTCPPADTVLNDIGQCAAVYSYTTPSITDNCPGPSVFQIRGLPSGGTYPLGSTVNTYLGVDAAGNIDSCSFSVTVIDGEAPVYVTCPGNIQVNADSATCGAIVTFPVPSFTDNCPGAVDAQVAGLPSGSLYPVGITQNIFIVSDSAGNSDTCSFTVEVEDFENPVVSCPANITVNTDTAQCSAVITYSVIFSDNCPGAFLNQTTGLASGSAFPVGTTTNTVVVTDSSGNTATCSFDVTVVDAEAPVIICPANIVTVNDSAQCGALVTYSVTSTDNCPGHVQTQLSGLASGSVFPLGLTTNSYRVVDAAGNIASCSFTVQVNDVENPVITCPASISTVADSGVCSAVVTYPAPTVVDNCPGVSAVLISGLSSGSTFPLGTTTNVFVATDPAGNADTCSFTVTVTDNQAPVLTCVGNIAVVSDSGQCSAVVTFAAPSSTDNCPGDTIIQIAGLASGSAFPSGTTVNTFVAVDASGNSDTCSFNVVVSDTVPPSIVCPANIVLNNSPGQCSAAVTYTVSVSDNCPGATISQTAGLPSSFTYAVGITTNSFIATDASGNTSSCSFTVQILDVEAPTITCPVNISLPNDTGQCAAIVTYNAPVGVDNCPGTTTTTQIAGLASGASFPVGITINTFVVTDTSGNADTCSFNVTITDTELPVVACPANMTVATSNTTCNAVVNFTTPTVTDNCPGAFVIRTAGRSSGSVFPLGTTTQTYLGTDAAGNSASCSFDITVVDSTPPVLANCPANISRNNTPGLCSAVASWTVPTASDNCTVGSFTSTNTPGSTFPVGITTVTYTATDLTGNTTVCTFTITVTDNEAPVLTGCPSTINVGSDSTFCGAVVTWTPPTATDNCVMGSLTGNFQSGDTFAVGLTTVTYLAVDAAGNADSCSFNIQVTDDDNPVFTSCPVNIVLNSDSTQCGTAATWSLPQAVDNCGTPVLSSTHTPGSTFGVGVTLVEYVALDIAGLADTCQFTVTVLDSVGPVFAGCPNDTTIVTDSSNCSPMVNWTPPTFTDNCGLNSFGSTHAPGATFQQGLTTVQYFATDSAGNFSTCEFNITVQARPLVVSNINVPIYPNGFAISCNGSSDGSAAASIAGGCLPYTYNWSNGGTSTTISNLIAGTYTITVTDGNGDSTVSSVTLVQPPAIDSLITVVQDTPSCIGDTIQLIGRAGFSSYAWSTGDVTQTAFVTTSGTYSLTVVDSFGCSGSEQVTVTVQPFNDPNPVVTPAGLQMLCAGDSIQLDGGAGYISYQWYNEDSLVFSGSQFFMATDSGRYRVRVENGFGCWAYSNWVTIGMYPTPVTPVLSQNGDTLFSSVTGLSYEWFLNGNTISGANGSSYIASSNGFYQVQVTDSNGCAAISDSTDILLGADTYIVTGGIEVYPSPFDRDVTVEFTLSQSEFVTIRVVSMVGREVYRYRTDHKRNNIKHEISLLGMSAGVYLVEVEAGDRKWVRKVVKQ